MSLLVQESRLATSAAQHFTGADFNKRVRLKKHMRDSCKLYISECLKILLSRFLEMQRKIGFSNNLDNLLEFLTIDTCILLVIVLNVI